MPFRPAAVVRGTRTALDRRGVCKSEGGWPGRNGVRVQGAVEACPYDGKHDALQRIAAHFRPDPPEH